MRLPRRTLPMLVFFLEGALDLLAATTGQVAGFVTAAEQNPVRSAIVYLGAAPQQLRGRPQPAIVDISRGQLWPAAQIARNGAPMILQNSDPDLHVVRFEEIGLAGKSRAPVTLAMPYAGFEKRFPLPDRRDTCLIRIAGQNGEEHKVAYIAVIPHPWAAVSDSAGRFDIPQIPPGQYAVYVWHQSLGTLTGKIRVVRNQSVTIRFEYPQGWAVAGRSAPAPR